MVTFFKLIQMTTLTAQAALLDGLANPSGPNDIATLVNNVKNLLLGVAGLFAVIMVVYGGVLYMTAGGSEERITKAKNTLLWALLGVGLIILAQALVLGFQAIILNGAK